MCRVKPVFPAGKAFDDGEGLVAKYLRVTITGELHRVPGHGRRRSRSQIHADKLAAEAIPLRDHLGRDRIEAAQLLFCLMPR